MPQRAIAFQNSDDYFRPDLYRPADKFVFAEARYQRPNPDNVCSEPPLVDRSFLFLREVAALIAS
jgi:hypothetical protein